MNQAEHDLLVLEAQDGRKAAMEALVRHHHRDLLRFAYSLCRELPTAQDAVQDAWIKVARRLRRLDDPRAFRGWLYHAVRWRVLDLLRQPHRRAEPLDGVEPAGGFEDAEALRDRRIDLATALDRLSDIEREALRLFHVSGLRIAEIALVLDLPAGTVKSRLFRARERVRLLLEGEKP